MYATLAIGIILVVLAAVISHYLKPDMRLVVSSVLNLVQGFLPLVATSFSVALFWSVGSSPKNLLDGRRQFRQPAILIVSAVLFLQVLSGLWSPDLSIWRIRVLQTFVFWILLVLALETKSRGGSPLNLVLVASAPLIAVQAASVVVFRVFPALEEAFLQSSWASFILGSSIFNLYGDEPNNVLDPAKSGGLFFLNANTASMLLGMYLMAYLWSWLSGRRWPALSMAVIALIGTLSTGSKTAFVLVAALGLLVGLSALLVRKRSPWLFLGMFGSFAAIGATAVAFFFFRGETALGAQTETTWGIRLKLWSTAAEFFVENPLLGLGFGGWEAHFVPIMESLELKDRFPPHNFLIAMWAESGLAVSLAVIALIALFLVRGFTRIRESGSLRDGLAVASIVGIVLWATLHGMADNTTFFGTTQTAALVAAACAAIMPKRENESLPGGSGDPNRSLGISRRAAPAPATGSQTSEA